MNIYEFTFEDAEGEPDGFTTTSRTEAYEYAKKWKLRMFYNTYEWTGKEVDEDFTGVPRPRFLVIEWSVGFEVVDMSTGKSHWMGDGVDIFYNDDGSPVPEIGTEAFRQMWEDSLNADESETLEAYFPEEVK